MSVITSGGAGGLLALARHHTPGVEIASVEPALRDLDDLASSAARVVSAAGELSSEVTVFIELPYALGWESAVELVEAAGLYGKIAAGSSVFTRIQARMTPGTSANTAGLRAMT